MTAGHVVDPERVAEFPLVSPAASGGLLDVFRRRYLLKLLVRKELQARYQGSLLGLLWSYVQPLVRFAMYFLVIGLVLGLHRSVPNFAIHMFAGIASVHFFTETFTSGTRSIVRNKALVRKMAMPREMFPASAVIVSAIHTFPQLLILFFGCLAVGWRPDWQGIGAGLLGAAILTVFGTALALLFSALNVFFKDFQNIVSTITLFTHWAVPMIYPFSRLANGLGPTHAWILHVYLADPLATAVLLVQRCFWIPTALGAKGFPTDPTKVGYPHMPHHYFLLGWAILGASVIVLVLCQMVFTKLETKIAERL
ncbi:MAG TPA: ABC transporter permease [Nocardioidaceae bacterium]|nr:ABC transporter permease [Nocardioidaceae bacterium]